MYEIEDIMEVDENTVKVVLVKKVPIYVTKEVTKEEFKSMENAEIVEELEGGRLKVKQVRMYNPEDGFGVDIAKEMLKDKKRLMKFLKEKVEERKKLLETLQKKEEFKAPKELLGVKVG